MTTASSAATAAARSARGLDHLVVGVHDLDAAGELYARLGFRVGARNRHPWGTENRIVQFPGAFLELLAIGDAALIEPHGPRRFSFGAFMRDALARGEGVAMLVLESKDAKADAEAFRQAGIGDFENFFFERQARRPDGSEARVAFSLAFAENPEAPECGFFTCQQHEPQNFWNPAFQQHENGASGLAAVLLSAPDPAAQAVFFAAYSGTAISEATEQGLTIGLPRGRIALKRSAEAKTRFTGFAVTVADLDAVARLLVRHGVDHRQEDASILVPANAALGCEIVFERG